MCVHIGWFAHVGSFFSIKFTYIQLDFDQFTSDFWFSGNLFGPQRLLLEPQKGLYNQAIPAKSQDM